MGSNSCKIRKMSFRGHKARLFKGGQIFQYSGLANRLQILFQIPVEMCITIDGCDCGLLAWPLRDTSVTKSVQLVPMIDYTLYGHTENEICATRSFYLIRNKTLCAEAAPPCIIFLLLRCLECKTYKPHSLGDSRFQPNESALICQMVQNLRSFGWTRRPSSTQARASSRRELRA
eukprot:6192327-Pleurochrysis_carterae.AAC.1